jgi:hypothetical protein
MAITYTLRYTSKTGGLIRMLMTQCEDDQDALQTASRTMRSPYTTLNVSRGWKLVWRGSRAEALALTSSPSSRSPPSYSVAPAPEGMADGR